MNDESLRFYLESLATLENSSIGHDAPTIIKMYRELKDNKAGKPKINREPISDSHIRHARRDLGELDQEKLVKITYGRPNLYSLGEAGKIRWRRLSPEPLMATGLQLAEQHLRRLFSDEMMQQYQFHLDASAIFNEDFTSEGAHIPYGKLSRQITEVESGQPKFPLLPTSPVILEILYRAMKDKHQLRINYRMTDRKLESLNRNIAHVVSPLGIAIRGPQMMLYARIEEGEKRGKERPFDISRLVRVETLVDTNSTIQADFDIEEASQQGRLNYTGEVRGTNHIDLLIHIKHLEGADLIQDIKEYRLSESQTMTWNDKLDVWELRVPGILRTKQLEDWIMSLLRVATVIEPENRNFKRPFGVECEVPNGHR
jgi:predicted DNA-binding transcriptional regulator YafY